MLELRERGATSVNIVDDQFVGSDESIERARRLVKLLSEHDVSIPFVFMSRADTVVSHPELFADLRGVGLRSVFIGLESGNDHVLDRLRKDTTASVGFEAVEVLADAEIGVSGGTILFHPWATLESLKVDVRYFNELMKRHAGFEFYGLNELDILKGTPLSKVWSGEKDKWRASWKCEQVAADQVYSDWLRAQRVFLYPFLKTLGPTRSRDLRREICRWMLDSLSVLIESQEINSINTAFLSISLFTQKLVGISGVSQNQFGINNNAESDLLISGERCFE